MVGKLIKYEFKAYWRIMLPAFIVLASAGIINRFIQILEPNVDSLLYYFYSAIEWASNLALIACIVVCFSMVLVLSIIRFYKNLFSLEGYLTFTLPVSPSTHILVKLLVAVLFVLLSIAVSGFSLTVAALGEMLIEVIKAVVYIFTSLWDEVGAHSLLYIFEYLANLSLGYIANLFVFYTCISIGQMAKKNRILAAFGVYFVYYIFTQIMITLLYFVGFFVLSFSVAMFSEMSAGAKILEMITEDYGHWILHAICLGSALFSAAQSVILFFINNKIIKSKLNLE